MSMRVVHRRQVCVRNLYGGVTSLYRVVFNANYMQVLVGHKWDENFSCGNMLIAYKEWKKIYW